MTGSDNRTIQGAIDGGYTAEVYCHNSRCGHHAPLNWIALRDRLGPDHGAMHDDIVPMLKCSMCGGRKVGMILTPGVKQYRGGVS